MDLALVTQKLFPGENVSPDKSSYEAMVSTWRGSAKPPTLEECEAAWKQVQEEVPVEAKVREDVLKSGVTQETMIEALFRQVAYNDSTKLDEIKSIIAAAELKFPPK